MKIKIAAIGALGALLMTTGCQTASAGDNYIGPAIGGVAGGILGNQIGKGSGKTIATATGAVIGVLVGQELSNQNQHSHQHGSPAQVIYTYPTAGLCGHHSNPGVRAACERGHAERLHQQQITAEKQAYSCARYGRCY
jgi:hypothetical protein